MTPCPRESAIVHAFRSGAETHLSVEQQDHLRDCVICREAVAVSSALVSEAVEGAPTADVVWFRAQLKARGEAAAAAAQPVFLAQALAGAAVVGAVAALIGALGGMETATLATRGLLLAFAVWLLIAPVAVYLATIED